MMRFFPAVLAALTVFCAGGAGAASLSYASMINSARGEIAGAGFEAASQTSDDNRAGAGNALGERDGWDHGGGEGGGFFALGKGGVAVFGFGGAFSGEISIFEMSYGCAGPEGGGSAYCAGYHEFADVYAWGGDYSAFDGEFGLAELNAIGFTKIGEVYNGDGRTEGGAKVTTNGVYRWLALVDTSATSDGFDVDAISVTTVPAPAALALLISALGGLGLLRRRRGGCAMG